MSENLKEDIKTILKQRYGDNWIHGKVALQIIYHLKSQNVKRVVEGELPKVFGSLEQIDRGTFSDGVRWCTKCFRLAGYEAVEDLDEEARI